MCKLSRESKRISSLREVGNLEGIVSDGRYYGAHNLVTYKGRTAIFKGQLVVAVMAGILADERRTRALKMVYLSDDRVITIRPARSSADRLIVVPSKPDWHALRPEAEPRSLQHPIPDAAPL